jgi:hypothetical protein
VTQVTLPLQELLTNIVLAVVAITVSVTAHRMYQAIKQRDHVAVPANEWPIRLAGHLFPLDRPSYDRRTLRSLRLATIVFGIVGVLCLVGALLWPFVRFPAG